MITNDNLPNGSICDINVRYNTKMERYTTILSDMNELGKIARMTRIKNLNAVCLGWLNTDTKKKNLGEEHKGAIKWSIIESN